ncbi:hypothetical protein KP79_PYT12920 [Mizuhopecten yessoensis]|uniref:Uncharacterized protein n=1 Tax=Mizuhopecten yessoensis TaxID=6573 RepID=A0A210QVZ3_MIZYE|nr:hypothetical protein KP79_PYT12920 [Mizuhopecten yessoensis]
MIPATHGRQQTVNNRIPSDSGACLPSVTQCGDTDEDFRSRRFGTPLEPYTRDTASYWKYENGCFRVDRNQFEDIEFSFSPENLFTSDSWRQREEQKKQQVPLVLPVQEPVRELKVKGRSVGTDAEQIDDSIDNDRRSRNSQPGKLCGIQNYYKLDPAECDVDYATLCINGQRAVVNSNTNDDNGMGIATSIVVEGEQKFLFSFGKCGRVAVMTPITEVPSQCGTPYKTLVSPSLSEETLSPASSMSYKSIWDCPLRKNEYLARDQYMHQYVTSRGHIPYDYEIYSSSERGDSNVYDNNVRLKKCVSEVAPKDPLVNQLERLSVLPERTRAAYNLPRVPVSEFGVPALSVSTATITNRYCIKKIMDKPPNKYVYKSLPPLYPTAHLEKGASNTRLPMYRSQSLNGLKYNTAKSEESLASDASKYFDSIAGSYQAKSNTRRKSDSDLKALRTKLPPLRKSAKKKTSKSKKKTTGSKQHSKMRNLETKVDIDPSPWKDYPSNVNVASEIETIVSEKLQHTFDRAEPETDQEPDGKLQSTSLILMRSNVKPSKSKMRSPYMSQSMSKSSLTKNKKRKRGFKNKKKNERSTDK